MDVTTCPTMNRSAAVRATPRQIEALRNAFSDSTTTSKDLLKRLSEQTGLYVCAHLRSSAHICTMAFSQRSTKWIIAWYARQRRKRRSSGDTSSDPATLPEDISEFKKEYRDPALAIPAQDGGAPNDENRNVKPPPEKRRRGRPPKHKVKAEQYHGESVLSSIQPSLPSSVLLAIDSMPSGSQNGFCSSSFMRPIAPRLHFPSSFQQHQVPVSVYSNSHGRLGLLNPLVSPCAFDYNDLPGIVHCNLSQECSKCLTGLDLTTPIVSHYRPHWTPESEPCSKLIR
jgi:hypothetical protein